MIEKVLFVATPMTGAPNRYRVAVPAEGLQSLGVPTDIVHPADPQLAAKLASASHVVVTRVPLTRVLAEGIAEAKAKRPDLVVAYDIDDPLFNPEFNSVNSRDFAGAIRVSDLMLGSTPHLNAMGRGSAPGVGAGGDFPNGIHPILQRRSAYARRVPRLPGKPRVGFMSGSGVHDHHWNAIKASVMDTLVKLDAELWVVGTVSSGVEAQYRRRVRLIPFMDWTDLPFWIRQMDLLLMPNFDAIHLANTKSHVKWLESALVETPTLATSTAPYSAVISHGVDGFLADLGESDWSEYLDEALSADLRKVGRMALRATSRFTAHQVGIRLMSLLARGEPRRGATIDVPDTQASIPCQAVTLHAGREKPRLPLRMQLKLLKPRC